MSNYILSIDQGTTSSRAIIFDTEGKIIATAQQEFPQLFPQDGWVEHDPESIWGSVLTTCKTVIERASIAARDIVASGITNQRETVVVWNRDTGKPIYNAIVWQDRRTASFCDGLRHSHKEGLIRSKTGLLVDPYFSASKIRWILDNVDGARAMAESGKLAFGTIDTFLIWRFTQGKHHVTDATNASRTQLFNIHTQQWDQELLTLFDIPDNMLPEVKDSSDDFGLIAPEILGTSLPIYGVAGDQQAALIGQACFQPGMSKSTYGTGCFMMLNTGSEALESDHRLLTTIAYRINGKPCYAIEGSIFIAGAAVQWLRDGLKIIESASDTLSLAKSAGINHGTYMVPAFTGLGAPYWDPDSRGAIFGLTRDTGVAEIVAAALQSVCYQTKDLQKAMEKDGLRPVKLRVDGGMVANDWLLQFLADILDAEVDRPCVIETTALGVAYLAGLKAGVYLSLEELQKGWSLDKTFTPKMPKEDRDRLYAGWLDAIERTKVRVST